MEKERKEILGLKEERNAIILAHNYQRPEIQDIADFVGDSLGLARKAVSTDAETIVFCGVDFMAETAAILNPDKKVLLPHLGARCPMAMMLRPEELEAAKAKYPDAKVVLYVNTYADVKVLADCICTSANAAEVVNAMDSETVLFGPDRNLMYYAGKRTKKKLVPVPEYGFCVTHHVISEWDLLEAREKHPEAKVVVHPEVIPEIQDAADHVASTGGILKYCKESDAKEFIIGTENGILHRLNKEVPGKKFYPLSTSTICPNMKMINLSNVLETLRKMKNEIRLPEDIASKARKSIERMLEVSR